MTEKTIGYEHICLRCGYEWKSFKERPSGCARCKSQLFDKPITVPQMGPDPWREWDDKGKQVGKKPTK